MSDQESNNADEPLFNIGVVSRMTDIAEDTLRIWERRYQFPQSARTAGGHRLYSRRDIARLKWVKLRVDEGMQVSKAIRALLNDEQEAANPPLAAAIQSAGTPLQSIRKRLRDALFAHDTPTVNQLFDEAAAMLPLEQIIFDVINPIFYDIGEAWETGKIDVATEHFATHLLRNQLLAWTRSGPPAFHVAPVVLVCAPGELHEGSLLILGALLRRLRWPVVYLGQSMPLDALPNFIESLQPSIIVFVAMTEETAQALAEWPHFLPDAARTGRPIVGYGGRAFTDHPELSTVVPGVALGNSLQEGIQTLDQLLHDLNPILR